MRLPLLYLSKVYYVVSLLLLPQRICTSYPPKWKIDRIKGVVIPHIYVTYTHQKKSRKKYHFWCPLSICIFEKKKKRINVFIVFSDSCLGIDMKIIRIFFSLNFNGEIFFSIKIKLIIAGILQKCRFNQFDCYIF